MMMLEIVDWLQPALLQATVTSWSMECQVSVFAATQPSGGWAGKTDMRQMSINNQAFDRSESQTCDIISFRNPQLLE